MEQSEEKRINRRIDTLEGTISKVDSKVDRLDEKLNIVDDKHDARHLDMRVELTELKGSSKATADHTKRMADSISNLVAELREINVSNNDRFKEVNDKVSDVKERVDSKEKEREYHIAEKTLSNKTVGAIILGGFGVLQIIIQIIGPALF